MSLVRVGDIRLNVIQKGKGVPVLFVHGYPLDHSMWHAQLDGLAKDCRMIAPDLRGFGGSDATPGTVTMQQMADDLAGLLDVLTITEPVIFCGLSMGGYVAWQFAFRHRQRLTKLILCDTRAIADTPEAAAGRRKTADQVLEQGSAVVVDSLLPKLFAPSTSANQPQLIAQTRDVILRTKPEGIAAALRGMADRPDVSERLPSIDVPALLVCGEHDAISPPDEMRRISSQMPNAKFVQIGNAGHMAPLEQPTAVNDAIRQFVMT